MTASHPKSWAQGPEIAEFVQLNNVRWIRTEARGIFSSAGLPAALLQRKIALSARPLEHVYRKTPEHQMGA